MSKISVADAVSTCEMLLIEERFEDMAKVLEVLMPQMQNIEQWHVLLAIYERVPTNVRFNSPVLATTYASVLAGNQLVSELLEYTAYALNIHHGLDGARLWLERAFALAQTGRWVEIQDGLTPMLSFLSGRQLGIAWRRLGRALFELGEPWEHAFSQARVFLTGRDLGFTRLEEGYCLSQRQRASEARDAWFEALPLFRSDAKMLAWVRYNLGIGALRDLDPEAERHFLEADRLTHNPQASVLRSAALSGLAGSRRVFGEWSRAESTYREALRLAADAHDRKESYFGLARTLRLAKQYIEALEVLEMALHDKTLEAHSLHVTRAKCFLALNQPNKARESLEQVGQVVSEYDRWLERIARAELARRDGHLDEAVTLLEGLPVHTLHAREEVRQWPQLFQLLEAAGKPVPVPLEYVQGTTVRVAALGVLRVTVNDRGVPIVPTGRVGELLVFLLEHGGVASLEVISEALYPDVTHERARKSVWMLVKFLRTALGWDGAVIALRAAYQLDPNVTWQYDVREARAHGTHGAVQGDFLEGVYSDWALEVGHELEALNSPNGRNLELN
jgi:tetratricopeptide (TPR) repeat protein